VRDLIDFVLARVAEREMAINFNYESGTAFPVLSPAEMLAECAAKRAIVESFQGLLLETYRTEDDPVAEARRHQAAVAVFHVATIYADHEDFREEWRP